MVAVGDNVSNFSLGDPVYAFCKKPVVQWGTYAQYVACRAEHVALKPRPLNLKESATIPLTALTAWQALFEFAKLRVGQTILIHAGAGGWWVGRRHGGSASQEEWSYGLCNRA